MSSNDTKTGLTGKELLLATLRHEKTPAVPWVPFAGVHAGKLKGYTATEVLQDSDKLVQSLLEVHSQYRPDGQPVIFDLQVEAEILGCELLWADNTPPTVASHPLATDLEVPTHLPEKTDGRLPIILKAMSEMKKAVGDTTALYGLVTGPFTLASHLRSTEMFMDMYENEDFLQALLGYTHDVAKRMAELYISAGMDVIAVVDPLVSQISPKHFNTFLKTSFQDIFSSIANAGARSSFFVCGDATKNIEAMCQTGPDSISVDENIDMVTAKQITDRYNIAIGGNIPLTSIMLLGTQQDNMKFVIDLLERLDHHNLILAPGCDMPYDVPADNVVGAVQAAREPEVVKKILSNYQAADQSVDVQLPDYAHLKKTLIEVFTIDSATCAACTYMVGAANQAKEAYGDRVDVVEYKIMQRENIARVKKLGLKNLPAMVINGELKYSSIIPSKKELLAEVEKTFK
jgi:uroporphyrinogen decarboxylase